MTEESKKQKHKRWRREFNRACLDRDGGRCVFCDIGDNLNVHHITNRKEMPNGGYAAENGITLCSVHHVMAEKFRRTKGEEWHEGFHPHDLYVKIGVWREGVIQACEALK